MPAKWAVVAHVRVTFHELHRRILEGSQLLPATRNSSAHV